MVGSLPFGVARKLQNECENELPEQPVANKRRCPSDLGEWPHSCSCGLVFQMS